MYWIELFWYLTFPLVIVVAYRLCLWALKLVKAI